MDPGETIRLRLLLRQVRSALLREDFDGARMKLRSAINILDPVSQPMVSPTTHKAIVRSSRDQRIKGQ